MLTNRSSSPFCEGTHHATGTLSSNKLTQSGSRQTKEEGNGISVRQLLLSLSRCFKYAHIFLSLTAAYFTQATVDQLGSIDDMRGVRELVVPDGIFKSTRVTKTRGKNEENRSGESSKSSNTSNAGASRYAPFPAPTLPNQPESSGQVLMYQPYPNHDASSAHQQPQIQDDHKVPPTQQYSTTRASNSNPAHHNTFRDLNPYSSNPQPYRSLLPSSHPRPAPDHLRRDLPNYGPRSEQVSRTFTVADVQHPSAPLPQVRLEGERSLSSHPPPGHISAAGTSLSNSHTSVNAMEEYTPNTQSFSALAASEWGSGNVGNSSMYYGDHHGNVPTSTAAQSTSYLPPPDGVAAGAGTQPYQPMQYLSPLHGNLAGGSSAPREPLPSLSTLQEAYSFSYDFSVAMVSQSTVGSSSGSLNSNLSPTSSSNSSQKPRTQAPGSNKAGGPCRDLDLAPLNSLSRLHPYRREPMDDRALRLLGPRSP